MSNFNEFLGLCDTIILVIEITNENIIKFIQYIEIFKLMPILNEILYSIEYNIDCYENNIETNKILNEILKKHKELVKLYITNYDENELKINISKLYDVAKYLTINDIKDKNKKFLPIIEVMKKSLNI